MINRTIVRQHIETDIADAVLDRLILDAFETVGRRYRFEVTQDIDSGGDDPTGYSTGAPETFITTGGQRFLTVSMSPRMVASVAFAERDPADDTWTDLEADDVQRWTTRRYERLATGTNPAGVWAQAVEITLTLDDALIERVVIDLVRLALMYDATTSTKAGDYSANSPEYAKEREAILGALQPAIGVA